VETDIQTEAMKSWENKSDFDKALSIGLQGPPDLKHDEKTQYLGEFKERVIKLLTKKQVIEPGIYPEIVQALKDERTTKIILSGDVDDHITEKYQKLAKQMGKRYTIIHDPEFKGDAGLIAISNDAVDVDDINVQDREIKFKKLGIPVSLVNYAGEKVCENCLNKILSLAPEESINYQKLTIMDRFWGEHCPACTEH